MMIPKIMLTIDTALIASPFSMHDKDYSAHLKLKIPPAPTPIKSIQFNMSL
jgi:hypothetical protein